MFGKNIILKREIFFALKIIIAAIIAIIVASILDLNYSVSAGIVAILSVAQTKKETLHTAINRLLAFIVALGISFICYKTLGVNEKAFFLYLFFFIIICQLLHWNNAMAMDSVLISHFISFGNMNIYSLKNELLLFIIGVGAGIIINLHLHKNSYYVEAMKEKTDEQIKYILQRMSERIINPNLINYDGSCFDILYDNIRKANSIALQNYQNQFSTKEDDDIAYIAMREKQVLILHEMYKQLHEIKEVPISAQILSDFFEKVSQEYSKDNTVTSLLNELNCLHDEMKRIELPVSRLEFENRARLFDIMLKLKEFLLVKNEYMKNKQ